jgi:proton-translocating NAD(P)+ transhydrogenase subunit alpha
MIVGIPKETFPGERRVAQIPADVPALAKAGIEAIVEAGAGEAAGFLDGSYREKGAGIASGRQEVFERADAVLQVRAGGANPDAGRADLERLRAGQVLIGFLEPYSDPEAVRELAGRKVTSFAMELIPRITRAQSMDALSAMATVAGYQAVLLAAGTLPKMFPMMMTAAGTIVPAKVFVVGAGVAGLQAIATSRRLGAVVSAYDVRPVVKEQVESLGARFVELDLETGGTEGKGGYAKEMGEVFYRKQREMMARVLAESDVVITTAAVPGKKAPTLITREMVEGMSPGSVVVDLAAERGGNCEVTKPGKTVLHRGVTILGPVNLPSTIPFHASQMYSRNVKNFLLLLVKAGEIDLNMEDEVVRETMLTRDGEVANAHVREILDL